MKRGLAFAALLLALLIVGSSTANRSVQAAPTTCFSLAVPARTVTSAPVAANCEVLVDTTTDEYGTGVGCSLREAIKSQNDNVDFGGCVRLSVLGPKIIFLPSGTYTLTILGANEDSAATGDLDIRQSVVISATGAVTATVLGGAGWAYFSQQRKMESRTAATGTVVELSMGVGASGHASMYYPVVEFTASSGEKIRFTSEFGSRPASHKIGQSVNVRYDAADPQKAEIESGMSLWLTPVILVFMGVIGCCLAVSFLVIYFLVGSSFSP